MRLSLSVVMPALNEEGNLAAAIAETLAAFDGLAVEGELIVVNDGSTDATAEVASRYQAADARVSVVHHERPLGIGRSFWDGKARARHEFVVMYPGDNEMVAGEMLRYLPLLQHADMVVPFIVNTAIRSPLRRFLSRGYATLVTTLLGISVHHTNGLVVYRKSVLDTVELVSNDFFYQTEILAKLIRNGYLYAEVPYYIKPRLAGVSKTRSYGTPLGLVRLAARLSRLVRDVHAAPASPLVETSATYLRREQLRNTGVPV